MSSAIVKAPHLDSRPKHGRRDQILWRGAALASIFFGIAARLWQYAANPSIWVDEAAIARNVLDRQLPHLFQPLDYGQLAPPGFLLGVKLSATLLGFSEYALRLVPIVAGVASVVLFFGVARAILRPVATVVATGMFSIAVPLVFFSSNLKQYSSDVAMTLVVIGIALRLRRSALTGRGAFGFALAPVLPLVCSQAAVFSLTAAGAVVFVDAVTRRRADQRRRFAVVTAWAVAVVVTVAYSAVSITPVDDVYLHRFWAQAFMPRQGWVTWLWTTAQNVFAEAPRPNAFDGSLHYTWPGLFAALGLVGGVALSANRPADGALVVGPVVLALLASAAHLYPLGTRVSLFLVPLLLLAVVAGADYLGRWFVRRQLSEYGPALLLPFAIATFLQQPPPRAPEHLRPVIQYVLDHWRPNDALWVYYGAGQAFEYYQKLTPISGDVRVGDCNRADPREYLHQVDVERGRARVWVLMAHGSGAFGFDERQLIISYLETIGRRIDEFHAPPEDITPNRAAAFLFDLSEPEKLAASSAKRFPIRNDYPPQRWSCYGTMSPLGANERTVRAVMNLAGP